MKRLLILLFLLANFATMAQRRIGIQDYLTVAALQAETINPSQNDKVYVKALQAVFAWDAASTAADNGVTVIKQGNITTGRFLLVGTSAYQLSGKLDATDTTALLRKTTAAATYQPKGNYGLLNSDNTWSSNNTFNGILNFTGGRIFSNGNLFLGSSPVDAGHKLEVVGLSRFQGGVVVGSNSQTLPPWLSNGLYVNGGIYANSVIVGHGTPFSWGASTTFITGYSAGSLQGMLFATNSTVYARALPSGNFHFQNGGSYTDIPSARVAINSTTQGFLPPRMTQSQRNSISSPETGLIVYCTDCTGGKLQAFNGSTWDSMGTSTWSSITGNILSNTDLKKALSDGFVLPEYFGAAADGTTDDVLAIQSAINYARDNGLVLRLSPVSYRITNTLVNQYDGNYKSLKVIGQGSTILCDTKGKKALNLTGGYALTEISNLTLKYTGTDTNADTTTNGLVATNVRCYLENVKVDGFLCDGFQFISTSPNMNSSYWEKLRADNNKRYGFYITGTDDNISVTKGSLYCENNGYSGIYVTDDCMIRDAEFFVYAENNCQLNQSKAGVYLGKIRNSRLTVYSEQTNSAEEIRLGANCTDNQLFSFRNNKDYFGGSNTGYRGNRIYQQDGSRASTPIVLRADYARAGMDGEYVKMDLQGVNINYGSLKGENDGIYLTNSVNRIGVTTDRVKINSTQPIITNGAFQLNGDGSSVANYINGDLAFRQVSGNNVYLDLSTANGTHGSFKIRSSNTYTTRFEVKSEGQINLFPLSSPPSSPVAGDMWYNSNTGKFQAHEGGTKNILTTYSSGIGGVTLASGVATVTITGLQTTDRAFTQLVATSGTLGTHYKAVCTANTLTITSVNTSGTTVTTDNSTLSYTIIR